MITKSQKRAQNALKQFPAKWITEDWGIERAGWDGRWFVIYGSPEEYAYVVSCRNKRTAKKELKRICALSH